MPGPSTDIHDASALVIDGNPQSRSILVSQLRELGVGTITQCSRLVDARSKLEFAAFDLVVCEQYFERENLTGQDLLDDLRRNQLLPFYTVFVMVTSEASYSKVAEAAESALDAYLLKPHTSAGLAERITMARDRKLSLRDIFSAIEAEKFDEAAAICKGRFQAREPYWLYAARIGAELMLRSGNLADAQAMYEAVVEAKTLPWAKLGVARSQLEAGFPQRAETTLKGLIETEPGYSDAYDVMGRAQFEQGNFKDALNTFRMSTKLTPGSVNRLLKHGMMAYYAGDREEGTELLERATRLGLDSKLYDAQALVLLAFSRLDDNDNRGLARCVDQLMHLRERQPDSPRLQRLLDVVEALVAIQSYQTARALDEVRRMAKSILLPNFDFESASNLLALMTRLAARSIQLYEVDAAVDVMGLRFCTSRALTELLACACTGRQGFVNRVRAAHVEVLKLTEQAMTLSLKGEPQSAVQALLEQGEKTLNAKIIESAHLVLQRYEEKITERGPLLIHAQALREKYRTTEIHAGLGEQAHTGRAAGGMSLPSGYKPQTSEGLLAKFSVV
ncbi:response regulator receiver protein [Hydrogenophaga crassostreae]|uniref:Response regulator n=1 Tax=Hydrogenophaga crassostreae TaxID=1763535 RepID=A0A162W4C2_9BURK|nr:response regulator [Hydrogenophaga crassostreae]AOW14212.1 response regulator [Hydrogenophaga crassostreae]OAD43767.1 response regulator receiver protein [Hydrogenophaga crassostreae]